MKTLPPNRPICFGAFKVMVIGSLCRCEFKEECIEAYRESSNNE